MNTRKIIASFTIALAPLLASAGGAATGEETERIDYYRACLEAEPGARLRKMAGFLAKYPEGEWSDPVRILLFGLVASEGWKEGEGRVALSLVKDWTSREGDPYLAGVGEDPDRLLLVSEAFLRAGVDRERALDLARRGGALAKSIGRPSSTPIDSWGRLKKERAARSSYLIGLALLEGGKHQSAVASFEKARKVFGGDPRFRKEFTTALAALGREEPAWPSLDDGRAGMEAMAGSGPGERIPKLEEYLRLFPGGERAREIEMLLVEAYASVPARKAEAVALAGRIVDGTGDPEVLSALAWLLADGGAGTERAVEYGARAVKILEEIIRHPDTYAEDLPALQSNLLLARDSYGWALLKDGRTAEAVAQLKRAAESGHPEVAYHYGTALLESGNSFDAAYTLVPPGVRGVEGAPAALDRIRSESREMKDHVDLLVEREEDKLRRRLVGKEEKWTAPDFSLVSLDGDQVTLSGLRGDVVVVAFWATWCAPCRDELLRLQNVKNAYAGKPVRFLAVNTDRDIWMVRPWLEEAGIELTTLLTAGEKEWEDRSRGYRLSAIPTTLLIDGRGNVRYSEQGYDGNGVFFEKVLSWRIDRLLGEGF